MADVLKYITGIQHIGIPTNDIEKTVAFYESIGFTVIHRTENPSGKEQVAFLKIGNLVIETYQNNRAVGFDGAIAHFALNVTDVNKVFEHISAEGYDLIDHEIQYLPFWENGFRYFNILGPNHEVIEFGQIL